MKKIAQSLSEKYMEIRGFRKTGAVDIPDERDHIYAEPFAKNVVSEEKDMGDLGIYYQDQGNTPACTAYALAHCINIELRKTFRRTPDVRGADLWEIQKEDAEDSLKQGDSLQHAMKCVRKYGAYDHSNGKRYSISFSRVRKEDALKALDKNNETLYTGFLVGNPFVSKDYVWNNTGKGGGHSICAFDGKTFRSGKFLNSWKKWGFKKTGVGFWRNRDTKSFFSFYSIKVHNFFKKTP